MSIAVVVMFLFEYGILYYIGCIVPTEMEFS
jgi:hypothetical protein